MMYMGVMCETCTTAGVAYVGTVCGDSNKTKLAISLYQPNRDINSHGLMAETMGHEVGRRARISEQFATHVISLPLDRAQSWNAA